MVKIFQLFGSKDRKFFPLFDKGADNLVKAAALLSKLFVVDDYPEKGELIKQIKEHEHVGDNITHEIFDALNKTFITPFDREDINKLTGSMDDVLDLINASAQQILLHPPKKEPKEFFEISELILSASRELKIAIAELHNLKNPQKIKDACIRINEIENQADEVQQIALSHLFENETDAIELIKIKDILESLEEATDKAEDVSDVMKSIIIKMA
jgi:hypothetical protein